MGTWVLVNASWYKTGFPKAGVPGPTRKLVNEPLFLERSV